MSNPFSRKLHSVATLPAEDLALVDEVIADQFTAPARTDLICEGEAPKYVHLLLSGVACRSKYQAEGGRQIVSYLIPGDLCDVHIRLLGEMDHTVSTITECQIVRIAPKQIDQLMSRPAIATAMWWSTLMEQSILREWVVNIATRPAKQRMAHLFCELYVRLRAVGLTVDHRFKLPLTQQELGETMGLSTVHVNRALQALRAEGLIVLHQKELEILDAKRLVELAEFNAAYLHFGAAEGEAHQGSSEIDKGPDARHARRPV